MPVLSAAKVAAIYDLLDDEEDEGSYLPEDEAETPQLTKAEVEEQTRHRRELFAKGSAFKPTSREDIVGIDNILGDIEEIIHWLRHSRQYSKHNSRLQPGVIFSGSPGTGKTLVSRWIATESGALFINVRDFAHKGALFTDSDIRELFQMARDTYAQTNRPIVLFWDEFENSAFERSDGKVTPEQRSVVSQLTAELDGVHGKNEGVLLIGCTNYASSIDEALARRGRMGVHIEFHAPDRAGKEKILSHYLGQMKTVPGIDIHTLSYFFLRKSTAADIEEACVEAWRHAVRRSINGQGKPVLAQEDLVKVFIKQLVGPPTTFTIPVEERMSIAIHECGHAITALAFGIPMRLITVQPGKKALGRVMVDELTEYTASIIESINHMKVGLGGISAERTAGYPPMTGRANDLRRVTEMAEYVVTQLGWGKRNGIFNMTALGRTAGYASMAPQLSEQYIQRADDDVDELLRHIDAEAARATMRVGKDNLFEIAEIVNERVTMTGNEFRELFIMVCGFEPELETV